MLPDTTNFAKDHHLLGIIINMHQCFIATAAVRIKSGQARLWCNNKHPQSSIGLIMRPISHSYHQLIQNLGTVLLPGKSHRWRSLVGAVHGVARSWTRLSDFTFTFHFHALEKEMATHSSVLAWRIPGTGEPGGLLSVGSDRVGHD